MKSTSNQIFNYPLKLSVIIALYNNANYIEKSILSVINSDLILDDYEIIVVNDGSTDGGELVVEKLINRYQNIILINKENGGQSSARNIGFEIARGKYTLCLDSDDYINSGLLNTELDFIISRDFDMYSFSFIRHMGSVKSLKHAYPILTSEISGADFLNDFTIHGAMCMYFYKTRLIQQNNLKLLDGVYLEDEEFVIKFMTYCKSIQTSHTPLYNYIIHSNSTTNKSGLMHKIRLVNDLIIIICAINALLIDVEDVKIKTGLLRKVEQLTTSLMIKIFCSNFSYTLLLKLLRKIKSYQLYPYEANNCSFRLRVLCLIFNSPLAIRLLIFRAKYRFNSNK